MVKSVVSSVAGAAVGGLLGGKKQTSTATTKPYMPDYLEKGYQDLYDRGAALAGQPVQPIPLARVGAPTSVYDNKGLWDLQRYSDSVGGLLSPLRGAPAAKPETPKAEQPKQVTPKQEGPSNKSSGTYYTYDQAKSLAQQGIITPSFVAYIDQLFNQGGQK